MAKCITEGCDNEAIEGAKRCKECRNKMNESKRKDLKKVGLAVGVGCAIVAAVGVAVAKSGDSA